jgi:O-antigen/teichoic acid export membrane protein
LKAFGKEGFLATRWLPASSKFLVLSTIVAFIAASILGWISNKVAPSFTLILFAYATGQASVELVISKFQLEEKYISLAYWQVAPHTLRLLSVLFLSYFLVGYMNLITLSFAYMMVGAFVTLFGLWQFYQMNRAGFSLAGHENFSIKNNAQVHIPDIKSLIQETWPFGLAGLFNLVYFQSDIILVKNITGANAAGIYSVVTTIMVVVYMFPNVVYRKYLLPKLHRWANHSDTEKLRQILRHGNVIMLIMGILVMFVIWLSSSWAVPFLFGEKYYATVKLLNVVAISVPIMFVAFSAGTILDTKENMKQKVKIMGFVAIFNIILNLIIIPYYGGLGAAMSTVLSNLLLMILYTWKANKVLL